MQAKKKAATKAAESINMDIVSQIQAYAYNVSAYLRDRKHAAEAEQLETLTTQISEAYASVDLARETHGLLGFTERTEEMNRKISEIEMQAQRMFADEYAEHQPELLEAYRRATIQVILARRTMVMQILEKDGITIEEARGYDEFGKWTYQPVNEWIVTDGGPRSYAEMRYIELFSDSELLKLADPPLLIRAAITRKTHDPNKVDELLSSITPGLIAEKWTINANIANESDASGDEDLPVETLTLDMLRHPFRQIPGPGSAFTIVHVNKVNYALTGVSDRSSYEILARCRDDYSHVVELNEKIGNGKNQAKTLITVTDENWKPMLPTDKWPHDRLISMIECTAKQWGTRAASRIFPMDVPVVTGIHWAFGEGVKIDSDKIEEFRLLLKRLRPDVLIDWHELAERCDIDWERLAHELGFEISRGPWFLHEEAPLLNTSWGVTAQVNRNGQEGLCFRIYDWPMAYVYSIATGYVRRIPDELISLQRDERQRMKETPRMLAVKSYLLTHIIQMYRSRNISRIISMDGLYTFMGNCDDKSRAQTIRRQVERYLSDWGTPRILNGMPTRLISSHKWSADSTSVQVRLVRGGLDAVLAYQHSEACIAPSTESVNY